MHVRALDRADFARLCGLIDVPLSVGADWQARVLQLQSRMRAIAEAEPLRMTSDTKSGRCAAVASAAFRAALESEGAEGAGGSRSSRTAVRRFGRQTVWCTVELLRRVLREAKWQDGDRGLSPQQAEARLASLAVAAIGGPS